MRFLWMVGLRFLKAHRGERFISLATVICIGGVALGVLALVVVIAVMNGFTHELQSRVVGSLPHVNVMGFDGSIRDYREALATIRSVPGVEAAAPVLEGQALLQGLAGTTGVYLKGIVPDDEKAVSGLESHIVRGRLDLAAPAREPKKVRGRRRSRRRRPDTAAGIVVGRGLARKIAAPTGSRVVAVTATESKSKGKNELRARTREYEVRGVFATGIEMHDSSVAFISLAHRRAAG